MKSSLSTLQWLWEPLHVYHQRSWQTVEPRQSVELSQPVEKKEDIDQLIILEIPYAGSQSSVCCNSWWAGVFHTTQSTLINCRSTSYTSVRFCKSHGFHSFPQDQREGVDPPLSPRRTWLQLPQQRTIHQVACALGESQVDTQGLGPRIQW